jgi:hypothetical protein
MPPVSSVATEFVTRSPLPSLVSRIFPDRGSSVPTYPCWVKNQIRPLQSGMVAIKQSPSGMRGAIAHDFCFSRVPLPLTLTFQISLSPVVG